MTPRKMTPLQIYILASSPETIEECKLWFNCNGIKSLKQIYSLCYMSETTTYTVESFQNMTSPGETPISLVV